MKPDRSLLLPKILFTLCIGAVCAVFASAGDFSKAALGTTGGQFLELPVGARGVSMGSAQGAAAEDVSAIYYNPANLAGLRGINATFMHAMYFQDISYDFAAFAKNTHNHGTFALGVQYLSVGSLDKVDNAGNPTGDSLAPRDLAVSLANARKFNNLEYGVGVKYISSKLNTDAKAYAADAGIRWSIEPAALSISVLNLGTGLKFREETAPLPTTLRIGSMYKFIPEIPGQIWTFALDGVFSKGAAAAVCAGIEYKIELKDSLKIGIRTGYNSRVGASGLGGLSGLSAGAGLDINKFSVDYAFTPFGNLGNSHRLSLSMHFGDDENGTDSSTRYQKAPSAKNEGNGSIITFASGSEAVVNVDRARLYRYSDDKSKVLDILKKGAEIEVQEQRANWVKVNTESGKTGWVNRSTLSRRH